MMMEKSQSGSNQNADDSRSNLSVNIEQKRGNGTKSNICPSEHLEKGKYDLNLLSHMSTASSGKAVEEIEQRVYQYLEVKNIMPIDVSAYLSDIRGY